MALLPTAILAYALGEHEKWGQLQGLDNASWAVLLASCVNGVAISWAGINAQGYVTATTFMVLGNLNKFIVIGFGILVLHEAKSWQARPRQTHETTAAARARRRRPGGADPRQAATTRHAHQQGSTTTNTHRRSGTRRRLLDAPLRSVAALCTRVRARSSRRGATMRKRVIIGRRRSYSIRARTRSCSYRRREMEQQQQ